MAKIDDLTSPDAWEAATQSYLDNHTAQVGTSIYSATGVDPDKAARAQAVGKTLGIPTQSVMAYPEDPERQLKVQQANPSNLVQTSPTLAQNLVNQNTANIIHDDLPNASGLERGLRSAPTFQKWDAPDDTPGMRDRLSNWWRGVFGQPTVQEDRTAQRSAEANAIIASRRAGVTGDDAAWEASRKAIGGSSRIPDIVAEKFIDSATLGMVAPTDPTKSHSWQDSVAGGLGQLAGFLTGPVKGANALTSLTPLASIAERVAGESFLKSLSKNVIEQAATLAVASGLEQAGHALLDTNSVGDAAKLEKDAMLGGAGTGAIFGAAGKLLPDSTILQGVLRGIGVNTAMGALHGDPMEAFDTVKDVLQGNNTPGLEDRVFNVLLNSVFSLHGAGRTEGGWLHDATKMKVAEQDFQTLSTIGQLSATSKWRERDPEGFKNFVQSVTEDGKLDGVYIEGKSFAQGLEKAGITPDEVRNMMPDVASQMNEAIQTDGYVRIPTEDYLTHIAGGELDKAILQHLKTDPDGMTYADAQKFYEDHTESLKALALEGVKDQAQIDAFKQSQEEVQNHIQSQLDGLGRHSTDVNKIYASVQASVLTRIAAAEGITPEEAFVKYGANVTGTAIGNGFNQNSEGPFGKIFTEHHHDAQGAIAKLSEEKGGEAVGALHHPKIGDIDLVWGKEGTGASDGYGLAKLLKFHPEVVGDLQNIVSNMELVTDGKNRKILESPTHAATVRLDWNKENKKWLLTAYEKRGITDTRTDTTSNDAKGDTARLNDTSLASLSEDIKKFKQDNRGTYTPENRTIALLKDANLTTYLHETGHWALDMYSHIAENNPAIRGEMDKLLNWFGVDSLEKWNSMSIDEQRQYHEQFARGFEAYLMEGKAPSSELRPIFARIKTWMLDFYKSLSGLNVELTPEVRGVFDRMLASEEAIRQAEAARVFEPLFKDKPDSMTDADWANYITLGQEGTQEAIDAMQAKSLRDMKWSRGAKSKALKAAQKQADSLRREVRMEVTKEVMSQPLYRAWTFLTAKQGDKVAGKGDKAYKANEINPNEDNIFTAISKLGGLKFEAVEHAWGVKDSERQKINEHGSKGKPVVHKTGGVEIDEMAEKLAREGYLTEDEHGKADVAELEAMFEDQRRGVDRYSFNRDMNEAYGDGWQALPDLPDMAYGKLSVKDIEYMFGDAKDAPWRKLEALKMTSKKDGLDPQIVAELFGLPSGKDLVKSLVETEHPKAIIEGLTDRRMLEQHGELATDRAIDDAASAAIHNDVRARFMATGLKVLAKSSVSARELLKGAREAADTAVGSKKVKDLNPRQYEVAESKANKQAIKDAAKDPATAVQAQRAALLNNQLVKSSQQAIADVRKGLDYQAKFDKPSVRENIDVAFRDQIDAIRAQYDFRRSMTPEAARENRLQSLESFVEKLSAYKFAVDVPEWMLDAANRTHYKDLTVDQFRGMIDAIKSIEHLGRSTQKVMDGVENRLLADVVLEAEKQLEALPQRKVDGNRGLSMIAKKWVGAKALGRSFAASLMKTEQICDWLDNHDSNGVFNRLVFRKIADAEGKRNDLDLKISKMVESYVASVPKELIKNNRGAIEMPGVIDALTGETQKLTWGEKIALAGIRGDAGHFAKLLKGEKWSADAVLDFLDKNMAKEEWDFVKGLSETFEELAPLKAQMMRELGSTEPKLVDKIAFKTQHGDMPGWYWPISYDPARSHSVKERNAKHEASLFEDNIFAKADTSTGRENTRNENYAKPMLLSIDTLPRILKDEIRDITTRKAIIEADRFLTHPDVRKGVSSVLSPEHYDVFNGWLLSLANDAMVKPSELQMWDRLSHELRTRTTMVGLGFRISTMVQHGLTAAGESVAEAGPKAMAKGLFNSKTAAALSLIGPEWMQKGLDNFLRDTQFAQNRDFIFERSAEMRHRSNEIERDVRDKLREIQVALMDPATGSIERAKLAIESRAYSGIAMLDMASALPTWMGGYLKALEKTEKGGLGMSEEDAVYFADKTVRNAHGGGGIKDLAHVQRGSEFFKLFTMFYTFWNHNINRIMDTGKRIKELPAEYRDAKESGDWAGFRGDVGTLVLRSFMYTLGVQAIHYMMHPPKEDDQNPEGWLMWFGKQMALSGLSGVPVFRDVVGHYAGGKDYEMSPIASLIHNTDSLLKDMDSNSTSDRFIKHALTEAGYIFGLPLGQPASTVQFLSDVWTGNQNPQDISEWWRGVTTGNTRDH